MARRRWNCGWISIGRTGGLNDALPYRVCLVRLAEGPLLVSNLVGSSDAAKLGAAAHVVFERATDDVTLPKFALD